MAGRKLGRGLQFLLSDRGAGDSSDDSPAEKPRSRPDSSPGSDERADSQEPITELLLNDLVPNPYQPRKAFNEDEIQGLAESIRASGILQPLLVRARGNQFEIIAGERRARAARLAGLDRVPVLMRQVDDVEMRLLALVENLQRADLDPIEKAESFRELKSATKWTHDRLAKAVGLNRSSVSNYLRLLDLDPSIRKFIRTGQLSMGHARALLGAPENLRARLADEVIAQGLSVRAVERMMGDQALPASGSTGGRDPGPDRPKPGGRRPAWMIEMEQNLLAALGCRVRIQHRNGKGRISLEIGSREEFDRVYELLMSSPHTPSEEELVASKKRR